MFSSRQNKNPLLLSSILDPRLISFLEVDTKEEALSFLVDLLFKEGKIKEKEPFHKAIIEREKIVSTGIGLGVALPHAKLPGFENFFIAIGVHRKGIAWDSIDGMAVRLIFMIGGPEERPTDYLQLLSRLTLAIRDEERRKKILQSQDRQEIMSLFGGL